MTLEPPADVGGPPVYAAVIKYSSTPGGGGPTAGTAHSDGFSEITAIDFPGGNPDSGPIDFAISGTPVPFAIILEKWDDSVFPAVFIEDVDMELGPSTLTVSFPDIAAAGHFYANPRTRRRFSNLSYQAY